MLDDKSLQELIIKCITTTITTIPSIIRAWKGDGSNSGKNSKPTDEYQTQEPNHSELGQDSDKL